MRKASLLIALVFAAVLAAAGVAGATAQDEFDADLKGSNETPPVKTQARGEASFDKVGNRIRWELEAEDIDGVIGGHIHRGRAGVAGPIIVDLRIPSSCEVVRTDISCQGTIRRADLTGPLAGHPLRDLLRLMRSGRTYVNVHTNDFPGGEIRGQIR